MIIEQKQIDQMFVEARELTKTILDAAIGKQKISLFMSLHALSNEFENTENQGWAVARSIVNETKKKIVRGNA